MVLEPIYKTSTSHLFYKTIFTSFPLKPPFLLLYIYVHETIYMSMENKSVIIFLPTGFCGVNFHG